MYVEVCHFSDGVHVSGPPNCFHMQDEDEQGPIQPIGWTVQNAEEYAAFLTQERARNDQYQ